MPFDSIGSNDFPSFDDTETPDNPNILGILGPYMSASNRPTFAPLFDNATARVLLIVDLPTPPLPDATAIIFVVVFTVLIQKVFV
jgi:hypothetical protein